MEPPPGVPEALWARVQKGVSLLGGVNRVRVLCHYDADGAAAAAILTRVLLRMGKGVHVSLTSVLDDASVARLKEESNAAYVVADMGSGQLEIVEALGAPAVVLDHHRPTRDSAQVVHVNSHMAGIDGAHGACGATLAWLFALAVDPAFWDAAGVAMAGAIADRQNAPAFDGLNAPLFEEAVRRGLLHAERRPVLRDRPLGEALAASYLPYFAGLSGRPDEAASVLRKLSVDPSARWDDLDAGKRRAVQSYLATHLMKQGATPEAIEASVEDAYRIEGLGRTAGDLSEAVNACCRTGAEGLGVAVALGDPAANEQAEEHRKRYVDQVLGHLARLEREGAFASKHVSVFYCEDASLAGNVAGIAVQHLWHGAMPLLAVSVTDGTTRISARGTKVLVTKGLDLAAALREAAAEVGGRGGGHDIASGATVPKGKEERFVALVDEHVGRQLTRKTEPSAG